MITRWSYRLGLYFLLAAPVLAPLFYLPFTTDYYQFNKLALFYLLTGLGLGAWIVYSIASKTVRLTLSLPLAPVIGLALAAAAPTMAVKIMAATATTVLPIPAPAGAAPNTQVAAEPEDLVL